MAKEKKYKSQDLSLYRRLLVYVKPYWVFVLVSFIANAAYSAIDSAVIYSLKPIINEGFIARNFLVIRWLPAFIVAAFLLRALCNVVASYTISYAARAVVMKFRQAIFKHLLRLPASYYDNASSGQVLSTILFNVEQVSNASASALTTAAQSGCMVIGMLVVMFILSWQLSLVYLVIAPLIAVLMSYTNRRTRRLSKSVQGVMGELTSTAEEAVEGFRVVRAFGGQRYEMKKFNRITRKHRLQELKLVINSALSVSGVQFCAAMALSFSVYLAFSHHINLSAGAFASLLGAMLGVLKPLKNMTRVNANIQRGLAGAQSVFELLDQPVEPDHGKYQVERVKGRVDYQKVSFVYQGFDKQVLQDISFSVEPGQMVALVGRSGGGKSTLVNLLPRFYENYQGKISVDGVDIQDYTLASLRQQFALVSQHVTLFNDTVGHNIAYGNWETVTKEDIVRAAKMAHAWEFIKEFPQGLKTLVGENGVLLSGGQRQRLALARAILKDAPVLILDEATAALDTESERFIQDALKNLMKNRTTLVIAHRLSTIENADKILVIDGGRVVEAGTHQELLALDQHYAKLHKMQFQD